MDSGFFKFLKSAAKINPSYLIPESSSLINLFEEWHHSAPQWDFEKEAKADQLILNLSYEHSTVFVLSQKRVIHVYNLNWNLKPYIEQISAKYRRSMDQALDYFFKNAFITQEEGTHLVPLLNIMRQAVSSLQHQLKLLLVLLKGNGHDNIQNIQLLGPGSCIQNLPTHLFQLFKIPVHTFQKQDSFSVSPKYFTALGVALSGCKRPKNPPVDLAENLKSSSEVMISLSKKKKHILKYLTLSFIVILTYTLMRNWQSDQLLSQVDQTFSFYARKIAGLKTRSISIKNVESFLKKKKTNSQTNKLYNTLPFTPSAMDLLKKMSLSMTHFDQWNLELSQFEINGTFISMQGVISKNHIHSLKTQLKLLSSDGSITDQTHILLKNKKKYPSTDLKVAKKDKSSINKDTELTVPFYLTFYIKK